jgi:hypothetical protein
MPILFFITETNANTMVDELTLNLAITLGPNPNFLTKNDPSDLQFRDESSSFVMSMLFIIWQKASKQANKHAS